MKPATKDKTVTHNPATPLPWAVFNAEGRLLARMESESEAYFYIRNRGHANGGTYQHDGDRAAKAYPQLVAALRDLLRECQRCIPDHIAIDPDHPFAEVDDRVNDLLRDLGEEG